MHYGNNQDQDSVNWGKIASSELLDSSQQQFSEYSEMKSESKAFAIATTVPGNDQPSSINNPWKRVISKRFSAGSSTSDDTADQQGAEQTYGQLVFNRGRPCLLRCAWICSRNFTCDRKCQCEEFAKNY